MGVIELCKLILSLKSWVNGPKIITLIKNKDGLYFTGICPLPIMFDFFLSSLMAWLKTLPGDIVSNPPLVYHCGC